MSDDKPKPPLPDEDDWDSALDAWETIGESAPPPAVAPEVSALAGDPQGRTAKSGRGPLYHPPAEASSTIPPPLDDAALASLQAFSEDDDEERTMVGRISPELLANVAESRNPGTGSGLGQVFRRNAPPRPAALVPGSPPHSPPARPSPRAAQMPAGGGDALIDSLFENPGAVAAIDEPSVVTSAPKMSPHEVRVPDHERQRPEELESVVAEGELFDPFAESGARKHEPAHQEQATGSTTMVPGAPVDEPAPPLDAASAAAPSASDAGHPPSARDPGAIESVDTPVAASQPEPRMRTDDAPNEPGKRPLLGAADPWNVPAVTPRPIDISESPPAPAVRTSNTAEERTVAVRMRAPSQPDPTEAQSRSASALRSTTPSSDEPPRAPMDTLSEEVSFHVLVTPAQRDAWWARAAWLEEEARASDDRSTCARGLLISSELLAMIDEPARSHQLAGEARDLAPHHPLTHRQSRALLMREGDWTALADALQTETRTASTPAVKAHGAIMAAEIARVAQGDEELATKRLDQAMRADPADPRAYLNRIAGALALGQPLPRLRFHEASELGPISDAYDTLQRWHRPADKAERAGDTVIDALLSARASLRSRDARSTVTAIDALGAQAGLREASAWLSLAITMVEPALAAEVVPRLRALTQGTLARMAQRALVGRALALGDRDEALAALASAPDAFAPHDRLAVALLAGADAEQLAANADLTQATPFVRAVTGALTEAAPLSPEEAESEPSTLVLRLARRLSANAPAAELAPLVEKLRAESAYAALSDVLASELDMEMGQIDTLAASIAAGSHDDAREQRDRSLVSALLFELAGRSDRSQDLYVAALRAAPDCEAPFRASLALASRAQVTARLLEQQTRQTDSRASALMLIEAAHVALGEGDADAYVELLQRAQERAPSLPFASWLAERHARSQGQFDEIVGWLRERRNASQDAVERAYDLVREALLIADRDLDAARDLVQRASLARPRDIALRELYERLSPVLAESNAPYWSERAQEASGEARARLALHAAYEYEMARDYERAAELAQLSLTAHDTPFARLCRDRNEARSSFAANLADRLLHDARATEDSRRRVEAYERLAEVDERSRDDVASAMLWHRSILEEHPGHLGSLSRLFHWLVAEGREDELEAIAAELAQALVGREGAAHAYLANRLRTRAGPWAGGAAHVRLAFTRPEPPLWAVRDAEAHAVLANDASTELAAAQRLLALTARPLEVATLALRAADAADRAGNGTLAFDLMREACRAHSAHPVAARALAELAERGGDSALAAEQWEVVTQLVRAPEHRLESSYRAAIAWLDGENDAQRGRAALEEAARIDVTYRDVFTRLQTLYTTAGDRAALAALLEARISRVESDEERVELEVLRGRTLSEIGDAAEAKRALSFALEARPDHPDALRVYADVCSAEGDWSSAEQALIRLSRLLPDAAAQAAVYARLGALYADHQPNPERAELAYREVLKRDPANVAARERLIDLYATTARATEAIELGQQLVQGASTPDDKRRQTIVLAKLYETVAGDRKRGETVLETARKEAPNDVELLAALAEMYGRGDRSGAAPALLDRAAGDARRALATGRFDVSLFATVAAVARLRGRTQAARIADATVAAMEGRGGALAGLGGAAAHPALDDQLAPELLSRALRTLLRQSGHLLDVVSPVDLSALRAAPLANGSTPLRELTELADAMGLSGIEVFVAPTLGGVCIPAGSEPARLVLGAPLLAQDAEPVRRFLATRALKIVQGRAAALARSAPIDLLPMVSAYLLLFAPDWQPGTVDPAKLDDMRARLARAGKVSADAQTSSLALEVIGSLGNRTSTLHTVVNGWGNRAALLASGDMSLAFAAIARAAGHPAGPAPRGPERITWIGRNAEARDLALFGVSDAYAELRAKLGADE